MNPLLKMFLDRIREPSSMAGVAAMLQGAKLIFPEYSLAFDIVSMVLGGTAVATKG